MNNNESQAVENYATAKKKRERPDRQVILESGDASKFTTHALRLFNLDKVDMSNEKKVAERVNLYFQICAEDDCKPSVEGLACALDIDRSYLYKLRTGQQGKNAEVGNILKRAVNMLNMMMSDYMMNGKINPVSGIFLMKNHFGYADKQEIEVTPKNPLGESQNTAEIEQRYIESVADDVET